MATDVSHAGGVGHGTRNSSRCHPTHFIRLWPSSATLAKDLIVTRLLAPRLKVLAVQPRDASRSDGIPNLRRIDKLEMQSIGLQVHSSPRKASTCGSTKNKLPPVTSKVRGGRISRREPIDGTNSHSKLVLTIARCAPRLENTHSRSDVSSGCFRIPIP